jgi:acyl-CoA dehydrogenase
MYRLLFNQSKKLIPRISETELIALLSGGTSIDREIFSGEVDISKIKKNTCINEFVKKGVDNVVNKWGHVQTPYPGKHINEILKDIGENKLFSLIIDEKYNGSKISITQLSNELTKLSAYNPALGVMVMVPNSLGPGELLLKYGTTAQKDKYLPSLSTGKLVPCFGLTGPNNGSDALGEIDTGMVYKDNKGNLHVQVEINKRYITLAPVANLIGLAINVIDHDKLLPSHIKPGVTVALLERGHRGLLQETFHNPLNVGFPNGTLKGHFSVPLDSVIGGQENVGKGWQMLMECLAAGRGVSLPATANGASKVSTCASLLYAKHRRQFRIPLYKMQGVNQKLLDNVYHTNLITSSINFTNAILDSGNTPSVISAIMKQRTTELGRKVINDSMDVMAGSAICLGENNVLEKYYKSIPVGITVEGSNTLTRSLIIFGQGLNKSHPLIFNLFEALTTDDVPKFRENVNKYIYMTVTNYISALFNVNTMLRYSKSYKDVLKNQTQMFAVLSNFVALKGGALKKEQYLSGDMADYLGNLYFGYSLIWEHDNNGMDSELLNYSLKRLHNENIEIINRVIDNMDLLILKPLKCKGEQITYKETENMIDYIYDESNFKSFIDKLNENSAERDPFLAKLLTLETLERYTTSYNELYNDIISVGEYKIN